MYAYADGDPYIVPKYVTNTSTNYGYVSVTPSAITVSSNKIPTINEIIEELQKRLAPTFTALKCRECGGSIEQKYMDPIVKCPYCGTVYVVGRAMINETY